jgi:DNA-binding MarR family transcriptional regulator
MIVNLVNDLAATPTQSLNQTEVANRLRPALLKLARELRRESHALGVTGGQVTLLIQIQRHKGVGVNDLAARERISPAAMSGHVGRLERAGLVKRTPHETDRRRQVLSLTDEGERVLRSVKSRRTAWLAARLKRLEPEDLAAVDAAVEPLLALLEDDR